jgi:hypothetical protein
MVRTFVAAATWLLAILHISSFLLTLTAKPSIFFSCFVTKNGWFVLAIYLTHILLIHVGVQIRICSYVFLNINMESSLYGNIHWWFLNLPRQLWSLHGSWIWSLPLHSSPPLAAKTFIFLVFFRVAAVPQVAVHFSTNHSVHSQFTFRTRKLCVWEK